MNQTKNEDKIFIQSRDFVCLLQSQPFISESINLTMQRNWIETTIRSEVDEQD